jgi:NitT/TauT family transport system ATP-binding protein
VSLILLKGVKKHFAGTGEVVSSLDLEIERGDLISFLGPSGCGKSTLLRLIAGLERPDSGTIRFGKKSRISFVFQEPQLLPWRNVVENVRLPLELEPETARLSRDESRELVTSALRRVGLVDSDSQMPHELSGGMKMRVSLARALVTKPEILLLDEPFGALDEITRFGLQADLRRLWKESGMTIIFVTHSMSEAAFIAERQLVFSARPARIIIDRKSPLASERDDQTRLSSSFSAEVYDLQKMFRSENVLGEARR